MREKEKKWEEHWGAKRKENWEKWIKVLNEEDKEIEKLFNRLNSLDVTGCSKNNFNSVRSKMRSFIERSENLLNNLPEQLSGDYKDKESSEFVKEFVELKEEINKILLSQKEAYQDSINYTEKIISFLSKMEMMDKTNQTHVPLTEILPK